jgi:hypothetical protein
VALDEHHTQPAVGLLDIKGLWINKDKSVWDLRRLYLLHGK